MFEVEAGADEKQQIKFVWPNNDQCKICWNKALTFGVGSCSPNTCKYVFNPNVNQSNCAEGLHFSAFHYYFTAI